MIEKLCPISKDIIKGIKASKGKIYLTFVVSTKIQLKILRPLGHCFNLLSQRAEINSHDCPLSFAVVGGRRSLD